MALRRGTASLELRTQNSEFRTQRAACTARHVLPVLPVLPARPARPARPALPALPPGPPGPSFPPLPSVQACLEELPVSRRPVDRPHRNAGRAAKPAPRRTLQSASFPSKSGVSACRHRPPGWSNACGWRSQPQALRPTGGWCGRHAEERTQCCRLANINAPVWPSSSWVSPSPCSVCPRRPRPQGR